MLVLRSVGISHPKKMRLFGVQQQARLPRFFGMRITKKNQGTQRSVRTLGSVGSFVEINTK